MTTRHELDTGWSLIEQDIDLRGRVAIYGIENTPWTCVRLDRGWRARKGRSYRGPWYESAPAVVRYLDKQGYLGEYRRQLSTSIDKGMYPKN